MKLKSMLEKIVIEGVKYRMLMYNHALQENLNHCRLVEDADIGKREDVLQKIKNEDFAEAARKETEKLHNQIKDIVNSI
jgi:hypothetical protein